MRASASGDFPSTTSVNRRPHGGVACAAFIVLVALGVSGATVWVADAMTARAAGTLVVADAQYLLR